jgi:hypothetical protein
MDPGKITDLRSALVNNDTLACIVIRNDIHKFMFYENYLLSGAIQKFAEFQENENHKVTDKIILLNNENDFSVADSIDIPKVVFHFVFHKKSNQQ